jgi:hypothetical protein
VGEKFEPAFVGGKDAHVLFMTDILSSKLKNYSLAVKGVKRIASFFFPK